MKRPLIALASLLAAFPALAFDTSQLPQRGSLRLDDMMHVIGKLPQLMREIAEALDSAKVKQEDVLCYGMRFPGEWQHLGGERVSPYVCEFARNRWLELRADVKLASAAGRVHETPSREAKRNASVVTETNPTWTWTETDPSPGQ